MLQLRVLALAILLAPAIPAYSQTLLPSSAPTMQDVDPGVDDSGRVAELSPEFRRKSVLYRTNSRPVRSSSTPLTATFI